ncbi:hypothetical protein [Treponema succinifaciens]|uniref:hypothetical protein n=1 Tax=Treponema succinifaciens TaxID=167 RepID=UPI002356B9D6|nr:hypothetical protein [Treponema succinifaciens]
MSVNQSALSALQQSVTASNAEAGAKSALATWKGMCVSWEQETADAVGKASANYAIKWNNAVMPEIEAKIQKFQAEYDEKKKTSMMLLKTSMTLQNRQSVMLKEIWMPAWIMRIMSGMEVACLMVCKLLAEKVPLPAKKLL